MPDMKSIIGKISVISAQRNLQDMTRRLALQTAKLVRGPAENTRATLEGIAEMASFVEAEAASWMDPEAIALGMPGPFDACDLRHWLFLAIRADVPHIPARQILTLSEDELSAIDRTVSAPDHIRRKIASGLSKAFPDIQASGASQTEKIDPSRIHELLFSAMEDIPWDWMVRSNISGSSMLKSLAGAGVVADGREGSRLSEEVQVGAGWVQIGNRRRIDATDSRFIETFACGHKPEIHYLARPWTEAGRRITCEDPHRHGTVFAGKGDWPAEWRVFVTNGLVTGVACYYAWIGEATPENAYRALEAVDLAQRIVDEAKAIGAAPRFMDVEILRGLGRVKDERIDAMLAEHPDDGVSCTLDFMETPDGMKLLEGGPAHFLIGGAHPCAFAGNEVSPETGFASRCDGVALKLMDHIVLADPRTWSHGETRDRILSWEEARDLAARFEPDGAGSPAP